MINITNKKTCNVLVYMSNFRIVTNGTIKQSTVSLFQFCEELWVAGAVGAPVFLFVFVFIIVFLCGTAEH